MHYGNPERKLNRIKSDTIEKNYSLSLGVSRELDEARTYAADVVEKLSNDAKSKMDYGLYKDLINQKVDELPKEEKDKVTSIAAEALKNGLYSARQAQNYYDGYYPQTYYDPGFILGEVKRSLVLEYLKEQGEEGAKIGGPISNPNDPNDKIIGEAWKKAGEMNVADLPERYKNAYLLAEKDLGESFRTRKSQGLIKDNDLKAPFLFKYHAPRIDQRETFYFAGGTGTKVLNRSDL